MINTGLEGGNIRKLGTVGINVPYLADSPCRGSDFQNADWIFKHSSTVSVATSLATIAQPSLGGASPIRTLMHSVADNARDSR
jgi:hypothetical protein